MPTLLARKHAQASTALPTPNPPFKFTQGYFTMRFDTTTTVRSALVVGAACKGAADRQACVERAYADPNVFFK
jgi:hypothetical protein